MNAVALMNGTVVVVAVASMHFVISGVLFAGDEANGCIAVSSYLQVFAGNRWLAGSILAACAASAFYGVSMRHRYARIYELSWLAPQQILLAIVGVGVTYAVATQHYADLVPRPWEFILVDQIPLITLFFVHASGIWRRARDS